jgi:hypothetical protein
LQADARNVTGIDAQDDANRGKADNKPKDATCRRQHDALSQQLTHNAPPARAHGRANGNLTSANSSARQEKVGDVGACNQQNETHGPEQNPQ